jgi:hypothetical protein
VTPPGVRRPSGLALVDRLATLAEPAITEYVAAASQYVRESGGLADGPKKAAQIRLSDALGLALAAELRRIVPRLDARAGEHTVSGALRNVQADVSEMDPLDGLRLAVELKPVNRAVGRAIWSRFGDIRTFAVNIHLKFPFAVVGGVMSIPTYEESERAAGGLVRRPTTHLIDRALDRLTRAGRRETEGDAPHLLEGVGVIVYDPDHGALDPDRPAPGSGLRWEEFVERIAVVYDTRFGGL